MKVYGGVQMVNGTSDPDYDLDPGVYAKDFMPYWDKGKLDTFVSNITKSYNFFF